MFLAPLPSTLTEHIAYLFNAVIWAVLQRERHCWVVYRIGPQLRLRMERLRNRVLALAKRIENGTFREWAGRVAAAPRREMDAKARMRLAEVSKLWKGVPRRWAWLCPLVPSEVATRAGQFEMILARPDMRRLLVATPRLARMLRPYFWMIGVNAKLLEVTAADVEAPKTPLPCPVPEVEAPAAEEPPEAGVGVPWYLQKWAQ